jgi:hypothetical protein
MYKSPMAEQRFTVEVQADFIERQAKARPIDALSEIVCIWSLDFVSQFWGSLQKFTDPPLPGYRWPCLSVRCAAAAPG